MSVPGAGCGMVCETGILLVIETTWEFHSSEGLFGSSIAAQTMQELGKQTSHAALRKSQVVSITSSIPVSHTIPQLAPGVDMLNSPTCR